MATIGNIKSFLGLDTSDFKEGLTEAEKRLASSRTRMNKNIASVQRTFNNLTRTTTRVASSMGKIGAVAGGAAAGLAVITDRALSSTQQLKNLSDQTGFTVGRIQELRFASQQMGVESETLDDALAELSQRMGEAVKDGGEMAEGFKAAGISIKELRSLSPQQVFNRMSRALSSVESESQAAVIATKAFGEEAGRRLLPLLTQSTGQLQAMADEARSLGLVMSQETVEAASQTAREFNTLKSVLSTQFQKAIAQLGPDISEFTGELAQNPQRIQNFAENVASLAADFVTLAATISDAVSAIQGLGDVPDLQFPEVDRASQAEKALVSLKQRQNELGNELDKSRQKLADLEKQQEDTWAPLGTGPLAVKVAKQREKVAELRAEHSAYNAAIEKGERRLKELTATQSKATEETDKAAQSAIKLEEIQVEPTESVSDLRKAMSDVLKETSAVTPEAQALNVKLSLLHRAFQQGTISAEEFADRQARLVDGFQKTQDEAEKTEEKMSQFAIQAKRNIQTEFAQSIEQIMTGNFDNILDAWVSMLKSMVAQAAARNITEALFSEGGGLQGLFSGQGGGFDLSQLIPDFGGGGSSTGGGGIGGPVGPANFLRSGPSRFSGGQLLKGAGAGFAGFSVGTGIGDFAGFNSRGANIGQMAGGALGGGAGMFFGGPLGAGIGAGLGSLVGGAFGSLFGEDAPRGDLGISTTPFSPKSAKSAESPFGFVQTSAGTSEISDVAGGSFEERFADRIAKLDEQIAAQLTDSGVEAVKSTLQEESRQGIDEVDVGKKLDKSEISQVIAKRYQTVFDEIDADIPDAIKKAADSSGGEGENLASPEEIRRIGQQHLKAINELTVGIDESIKELEDPTSKFAAQIDAVKERRDGQIETAKELGLGEKELAAIRKNARLQIEGIKKSEASRIAAIKGNAEAVFGEQGIAGQIKAAGLEDTEVGGTIKNLPDDLREGTEQTEKWGQKIIDAAESTDQMNAGLDILIESLQESAESSEEQSRKEQARRVKDSSPRLADQADNIEQANQQIERSFTDLADFLTGLVAGPDSPLSPERVFKNARQEFNQVIDLPDPKAREAFPEAAQNLLDAAREMFASSPRFFETFNRVQQEGVDLLGNRAGDLIQGARPGISEQQSELQQEQTLQDAERNQTLNEIREELQASREENAELREQLQRLVS